MAFSVEPKADWALPKSVAFSPDAVLNACVDWPLLMVFLGTTVGGLVIAGLMGSCGYYAASALGWVPRPPLQRAGLSLMACVCLGRALLLPALAVRHPELRNTFAIVAATVWGTAGVGLAVAFRLAKAEPNNSPKPTPRRGAA